MPCQVLERQAEVASTRSITPCRSTAAALASIWSPPLQTDPPLGYCTLIATQSPTRVDQPGSLFTGPQTLENEHLRVTIAPNGTLTLQHLTSGYQTEGLLAFADEGDVGDG